jgi:hypothetical protein
MFVNIVVNEMGRIERFISRSGELLLFEKLEFFKNERFRNPSEEQIVLTGELLHKKITDREEANGLFNSVRIILGKTGKERERLEAEFLHRTGKRVEEFMKDSVITLWDYIPFRSWSLGRWDVVYPERRKLLLQALEGKLNYFYPVSSPEVKNSEKVTRRVIELYNTYRKQGYEGAVVKAPERWEDGKPVWQIKIKPEITLDLRIVGVKFGEPDTKYEKLVNRLIVESDDKTIRAQVSGLTEKQMLTITRLGKDEVIGKIAEVKCTKIIKKEGKCTLLHPRFVEIRYDKNTTDVCTLLNRK